MKQTLTTTLGLLVITILAALIIFVILHENIVTTDQVNEWTSNSWVSTQLESVKTWASEINWPWNN